MGNNIARQAPLLAVIVPCYNEEQVMEQTAARLRAVLDSMIGDALIRPGSFVYFVDDGSVDSTWSIIEKMSRENAMVKGLKLSRNFGHQNALIAGLTELKDRADCTVSIDADLQQDEKAMPGFVRRYLEGADIVFGVRNDRSSDSLMKRSTALAFYRLMRLMGVNIKSNHADYRLVSRRAAETIADYGEVNIFLRGMFTDIGFRTAEAGFDVSERTAGESKYSAGRMIGFALDGITSFSVVPLRVVAIVGFFILMFSLLMIGYALVKTLVVGGTVPGWASTVIPVYVLGGLQIMSIGIVGEYVGKIYKEVKKRPRYIKEEEIN
ncbi:MAG TPA: glycosyltransferase family 2 protein [bacterium]|nr:glycosyltransferase family 2 protein [bacterium]